MESQKVLCRISLKSPTISTHFQRPLKELENTNFKVDDFSNNKRSNGSKTHPLKSAILMSRASRSVVRHLREKSPDTSPRYKSPETSSGDLQVPAESPPRTGQPKFICHFANVHSALEYTRTGGSPIVLHRHNKRDIKGRKLASTQT